MKKKRKGAAGDGPLAGKTMAMIFDRPSTRTRVSFDVAMRQLGGESIMLTGAGDAARPRRDHRRHRARAVALCRCHHDPHARPRAGRRACGIRHRAGDQRPHQALASLPGDGRRDDLRGASRRDQGPHRGLDRRRQQRAGLLDARGRSLRFPAPRRDAARAQAEEMAARLGQGVGRRDPDRHRSGGGGEGRRLRRHRHLGVDGRPRRPAGATTCSSAIRSTPG